MNFILSTNLSLFTTKAVLICGLKSCMRPFNESYELSAFFSGGTVYYAVQAKLLQLLSLSIKPWVMTIQMKCSVECLFS